MRLGMTLLCCPMLASCGAALSSHSAGVGGPAPLAEGQVYFLPRAVIHAHLYGSRDAGLSLVVDVPELVADTGEGLLEPVPGEALPPGCTATRRRAAGPYLLRYRVSGFHEDTIAVEAERNLLKSVSADTKERVTAALTNAAKSAAALGLEAAVDGAAEELASVRFDPADCADLARANLLLQRAVEGAGLPRLAALRAEAAAGSRLATLAPAVAAPALSIALAPYRPFVAADAGARRADCTVGICVPVQKPARLVVTAGGIRRETAMLFLPNLSEPVAVPVDRSGLADVKTDLTLESGLLTKRSVTRKSEVAAALLLPAALVGAYLDELAAGFTKRAKVVDERAALDAAREEAEAESALVDTSRPLLEMPLPGLSVGRVAAARTPPTMAMNPSLPVRGGTPQSSGNDGTLGAGGTGASGQLGSSPAPDPDRR